MKEFKMKAWLKKENKMVAIIGIDLNYQYIRYTVDGNLFKADYKIADFKDIELLQFTGTKDKAGQELYEADVILFNDGIDDIYGLISYDDDEGTYRVSYENITEHLSEREGDFEIVGNIFENPQLHEQLGY
ncbi:YopX family protein [Fusobacterium polymorphum]